MGNDSWIDISSMDALIVIGSLGTWAVLMYVATTLAL